MTNLTTPRRFSVLLLATLGLSACDSEDLVSRLSDSGVADAAQANVCDENIVFLNRNGGTYRDGESSAIDNQFWGLGEAEIIVTPPGIADDDWEEITECVRDLLAPYNLSLVNDDPAAGGAQVVHHEILMIRKAEDFGYLEGTSDIYYTDCEGVENVITPVILELRRGPRTNREVCEVIVASVGFAGGLEQVGGCSSLFSLTFGESNPCGDRTILNASIPCGDFPGTPGACRCTGGRSVNPHEQMLDAYGPFCRL